MINYIYQLISPKVISVEYKDVTFDNKVIVRPEYMAVCHADQRYYLGQRDQKVLDKKLPMALIHECCGRVIYDPTGQYHANELVALIPNVPGKDDSEIYENYRSDSSFLSSGHDGFMREYVDIPASQVVSVEGVPAKIAAISEFISVGVHAVSRFELIAHNRRKTIGVWGDGSLAYTVSLVIKKTFPECDVVIIGRNERKLSYFTFAKETYIAKDIPEDFHVDHAFECCGGEGSYYAIDDIIKYIVPQGTVMLMGVSENRVAVNTRNVLEKGLTMVGCSRSGRHDFLKTAEYLRDEKFRNRISRIIFEDDPACSIEDIHRVFATDMDTMFKTVFKWKL